MMRRLALGFGFCVLMTMSGLASAQNLTMRSSPRSMQGIRPLGMGDAFIAATGTDENAIFYNPAAIDDYEDKVHMQFLLPTVEFSAKSISYFKDDIPGLADDINAANDDAGKIDAFNAFAAKNTGRYEEIGVRGNIATFMHKYVAASLFYENRSVVALTNPSSSTIDIESLSQGGLQVGGAYHFWDERLQVGAAVKFIERYLIDETITQRDILANSDFGDILDLNNKGFGVGFDVGAKTRLPIGGKTWEYLDPVFALVWQDVGSTRFSNGVGRQNQNLSAGVAVHPGFSRFQSLLALDVRDLAQSSDILTKLHVGYELTLPEISKVLRSVSARVGLSQGYFTGGLGFDFKYFKINAATWGREIAERTYQKQSRMFGFQLAAGF